MAEEDLFEDDIDEDIEPDAGDDLDMDDDLADQDTSTEESSGAASGSLLDRVKTFFSGLSRRTIILFIIGAVVIFVGGIFLQIFSKPDKENLSSQPGAMLNQASPPSFDSSSM